jgi:dTDP-4-dehydrorhamnose reductase
MVYSTKEFQSMFDCLLKSNAHYMFISTYRVFQSTGLNPITENSPFLLDSQSDEEYLRTDEYALAKARQERILQKSSYTNWTIARPSITYSTNRFQLGTLESNILLSRATKGLPVPIPQEVADKHTTMTWAGDVAMMLCSLMLKEESFRADYNVLTSESLKWRDIAGVYKDILDLDVREVNLESFKKLQGNTWQLKYDRMVNRVCCNQKILQATGLRQDMLMSIRDGISLELSNNKKVALECATINRMQGRVDRVLKMTQFPKNVTKRELASYLVGRVALLDLFMLLIKK